MGHEEDVVAELLAECRMHGRIVISVAAEYGGVVTHFTKRADDGADVLAVGRQEDDVRLPAQCSQPCQLRREVVIALPMMILSSAA